MSRRNPWYEDDGYDFTRSSDPWYQQLLRKLRSGATSNTYYLSDGRIYETILDPRTKEVVYKAVIPSDMCYQVVRDIIEMENIQTLAEAMNRLASVYTCNTLYSVARNYIKSRQGNQYWNSGRGSKTWDREYETFAPEYSEPSYSSGSWEVRDGFAYRGRANTFSAKQTYSPPARGKPYVASPVRSAGPSGAARATTPQSPSSTAVAKPTTSGIGTKPGVTPSSPATGSSASQLPAVTTATSTAVAKPTTSVIGTKPDLKQSSPATGSIASQPPAVSTATKDEPDGLSSFTAKSAAVPSTAASATSTTATTNKPGSSQPVNTGVSSGTTTSTATVRKVAATEPVKSAAPTNVASVEPRVAENPPPSSVVSQPAKRNTSSNEASVKPGVTPSPSPSSVVNQPAKTTNATSVEPETTSEKLNTPSATPVKPGAPNTPSAPSVKPGATFSPASGVINQQAKNSTPAKPELVSGKPGVTPSVPTVVNQPVKPVVSAFPASSVINQPAKNTAPAKVTSAKPEIVSGNSGVTPSVPTVVNQPVRPVVTASLASSVINQQSKSTAPAKVTSAKPEIVAGKPSPTPSVVIQPVNTAVLAATKHGAVPGNPNTPSAAIQPAGNISHAVQPVVTEAAVPSNSKRAANTDGYASKARKMQETMRNDKSVTFALTHPVYFCEKLKKKRAVVRLTLSAEECGDSGEEVLQNLTKYNKQKPNLRAWTVRKFLKKEGIISFEVDPDTLGFLARRSYQMFYPKDYRPVANKEPIRHSQIQQATTNMSNQNAPNANKSQIQQATTNMSNQNAPNANKSQIQQATTNMSNQNAPNASKPQTTVQTGKNRDLVMIIVDFLPDKSFIPSDIVYGLKNANCGQGVNWVSDCKVVQTQRSGRKIIILAQITSELKTLIMETAMKCLCTVGAKTYVAVFRWTTCQAYKAFVADAAYQKPPTGMVRARCFIEKIHFARSAKGLSDFANYVLADLSKRYKEMNASKCKATDAREELRAVTFTVQLNAEVIKALEANNGVFMSVEPPVLRSFPVYFFDVAPQFRVTVMADTADFHTNRDDNEEIAEAIMTTLKRTRELANSLWFVVDCYSIKYFYLLVLDVDKKTADYIKQSPKVFYHGKSGGSVSAMLCETHPEGWEGYKTQWPPFENDLFNRRLKREYGDQKVNIPASFIIAIAPKGYPNEKLSDAHIGTAKRFLLSKTQPFSRISVAFIHEKSFLLLRCLNQESVEWIKANKPRALSTLLNSEVGIVEPFQCHVCCWFEKSRKLPISSTPSAVNHMVRGCIANLKNMECLLSIERIVECGDKVRVIIKVNCDTIAALEENNFKGKIEDVNFYFRIIDI